MRKKIRTIIAGCTVNGNWDRVVMGLSASGDIDIKYCVIGARRGFEKQCDEFKASHHETVFQNTLDAVRGKPAIRLPESAIDESLLLSLSEFEPIVFRMMERLDPMDCFNYSDRYRHYLRLVRYWSAVLDHMKPEFILFSITPHMVWDYVLYLLAKQRGINTLMFNTNSALGRVMWSETIEGYCDRVNETIGKFAGESDQPNKEHATIIEQHIKQTRKDYSDAKPRYMLMLEELNQSEMVKWSFVGPLAFVKSLVWKLIVTSRRFNSTVNGVFRGKGAYANNYWKHPDMPYEDSSFTAWEIYQIERHKVRKLAGLKKAYDSLCESPEQSLKQPFIFVALHYQPETTTCPEGGYFAEQRLMIDLLAKNLPENWVLLVKEHYLQHQVKASKGWQGRTSQFYFDICTYPNVKLVPTNYSSFTLIDNCCAVATVTGYAAWEAIVRGKQAILFGRPWFGYCPGAHMVKSEDDVRNAVSEIVIGATKVDKDDVSRYLLAYLNVSFSGFRSKWNKSASGLTTDQNVEAFNSAISQYLRAKFS